MKSSVVTVTLNPALDKTITLSNFQIGGLNRVQDMRLDPGGKGINVAKVLNEFDVDVIATGLVAGSQGRQLLKQLEEKGISFDFTEIQGETRTNIKIVDEETKITTEVNEVGFAVSSNDLHLFREKLTVLLHQASVLVLGGSLPPGIPEDVYRDFVEIANQMGVKTILDADGSALYEGIKAKPYAIKPNIYELEQLVGRKLDTKHEIVYAGKELVDRGISSVVISMGSQGSIIMDQKEAYRVTPFPIVPKSTVGAGDSMVAALVYCILQGKSLEQTGRWTTTAGTVTASKMGTQVCTIAEVQSFVNQVHATKI